MPLSDFLASYVRSWVQPMSFRHRDVEIGPVGSDWEQLVVTRVPPRVAATGAERLQPGDFDYPSDLVPESLLPKRPDLFPFRRVFWN